MSEPLQREWRFYVTDMISFAEKVVVYTEGMDQEKFVASGLNYDATVHNLMWKALSLAGAQRLPWEKVNC